MLFPELIFKRSCWLFAILYPILEKTEEVLIFIIQLFLQLSVDLLHLFARCVESLALVDDLLENLLARLLFALLGNVAAAKVESVDHFLVELALVPVVFIIA